MEQWWNLQTAIYKMVMWNIMNEIEKPMMRKVYQDGAMWNLQKNKFLTVTKPKSKLIPGRTPEEVLQHLKRN
jgi:hypothetical protein